MSQTELEPISPAEAKEMYLNARKGEVSESTLSGYHYRLKHFIRWSKDVEDLDNMNDLSGRKLQKFRAWRRDDGDLKPITLQGQLDALRIFVRWCESIDGVEQGLHEKITMPVLSKSDEQREETLHTEEAEKVLDYLRRFEYASRAHIILELLWHTGMRLGALRSLDLEDYDSDNQHLTLCHRPKQETPLKNGPEGERLVALGPDICDALDDWIEQNRTEITDEYGRNPLLTTSGGRMVGASIRDAVYRVTRPCYYTNRCPHNRDMDSCEATNYGHYSKCPLNVSPHSIRRGSITYFLLNDVPETVVSDRMNVGQDVLDKHYDKRTEDQKMEQRRHSLITSNKNFKRDI